MQNILLPSVYLGNVQYFSKFIHFPIIHIEQHCNYIKQTYHNRCKIATANGVMQLSIPTEKSKTEKCKIKDIRIATNENWQLIHWRAIEAAYNSSPFFEYYKDDLLPFYTKKYEFLLDFNTEIQQVVLELLDIETKPLLTAEYEHIVTKNEIDFREQISPKKEIVDKSFVSQPYYQIFEHKFGFLPNLSVIDLLFNMGNESLLVLKKCCSYEK